MLVLGCSREKISDMDNKRLEWKVGLFVFIGLVLLALLLIQFSKGTTFFRGTYQLQLHASNVGGLKRRALVLLSGVQVGTVSRIQLAPDGKSVNILLKVYDGYTIYSDARFVIEQSGFLGDQFVAVIPTLNQGAPLTNGAVVKCEEPFNLQEVARSAAGFVRRIDETAQRLNDAIADVRKYVLNEQTLTNVASAVGTIRIASEHALVMVDKVDTLVETNRESISLAMSNVVYFSEQINSLADKLGGVVTTNSAELNVAMKNISDSSAVLKNILNDVQSGKGLAGDVLKNETLATNVNSIAENLAIASSNLNRLGLWKFLFHKEPPRTNAPADHHSR
jgi:phospholipid/cholesterol/gamma-HCH transport system substrate-binding protein